jgi:Bacterial Ig domain
MNKIVTENSQAGAPASEWDILGTDDGSIEGFATEMSVNLGETVHFKINTAAIAYRLDIYRMGFYAGNGARKVATIRPAVGLPQFQPPGLSNPTGLLDCGNWAVSASWSVPTDAVSGIYFAKLVREDGNPSASHIFFVVRDDDSDSALLFQTSDTTWQAYNTYGASLYIGGPGPRGGAYKVSYNRPITTRKTTPEDWVFNAEYPMVRWLEANGFDVNYCSGVDTDRFGDTILQHKVLLSVGHDEYWSAQQRANVEAARDAGVHLAFLSGNEVFWKTRWEESIDGSKTPYRTLVCYKDTHANTPIDPTGVWTGTWRDPRFSPPADGGRPENALTGTTFAVFGLTDNAISVPAEEGKLRFWRNTTMANLAPGSEDRVTTGTLGYEWDVDVDNGFRPAGLIRLSSTVISTDSFWFDNDSTGPATATHHLTLYRHKSGALVFGAGTVQWSWGLDNHHDARGNDPSTPDLCVQQAMVNLFADMGVQPASLQPDLVPESASTDTTAPTSSISFPSHGDILQPGQPINIQNSIIGSATDIDGKVAAVEVSVDGGLTWHPAVGRESWSYPWTPSGNGLITILSRAVDDSGNLEVPSAGIDVIVGAAAEEGPGGPILVIVNGSYSQKNPFGNYLGEILRAEGLVAFKTIELTLLMRGADPISFLNTFKLVLLAETLLLPEQLLLMRDYVSGGGNLIAMRPDPALADLLGLSLAGHRPEELGQPQFFAFETSFGPGIGIQSGPLQYHGDADLYGLAGATAVAHLWQSIGVPSVSPAVTVNTFGSGTAAAFTFDLAKSIVLMRQGNPQWKDSEGDGVNKILPSPTNTYPPDEYRPMDMFTRLDGRIWFAPECLPIPQADEQQRFFANLILTMIGQPVPRLWYLPSAHKTLIINTGDGEDYSSARMQKVIDDAASHGGTFSTYLTRWNIDMPVQHPDGTDSILPTG